MKYDTELEELRATYALAKEKYENARALAENVGQQSVPGFQIVRREYSKATVRLAQAIVRRTQRGLPRYINSARY